MKKQILTGAESFEELVGENYFYVDKTLFIKELLENRGKVTLITRPRRFGKTLNMDMLKCFFDINKESEALFDGLQIMGHKDMTQKHMNKYPVVFLTLKNIEASTFEGAMEKIRSLVSSVFHNNMQISESGTLNEFKLKKFNKYCAEEATDNEMETSLLFLAECLALYKKKRVIILLDEYDTPLNNALTEGYYDKMLKFMRGFMGSVFKTNDYLEFGVLTGVQRISKEGLVSSFNNPLVCGIMDNEFATSFGFTESEVMDACEKYSMGSMFGEVKRWYDGYRFGGRDMYNPWSITGFLKRKVFEAYWVNTGSMSIFQDIYQKGDQPLKDDIAGLMTGSPVSMQLKDGITYPTEYKKTNAFWNLLLNAGYIKPVNGARGGRFDAEIVNMEVMDMFAQYANEWFEKEQPYIADAISKFATCLLEGDAEGVSAVLNDNLLNNPSCHDFKEENSYHMFIFGMLLASAGSYTVYSNPESGKGRADVLLKPTDKNKPAAAIDFKHRGNDGLNLKQEAQKGLEQINEKSYVHNLKQEGYKKIYKYGIAFHKKSCELVMEVVE